MQQWERNEDMPVTPVLGRTQWEDRKFETSLGYRVRPFLKIPAMMEFIAIVVVVGAVAALSNILLILLLLKYVKTFLFWKSYIGNYKDSIDRSHVPSIHFPNDYIYVTVVQNQNQRQ
jgi:hypothetical protein